MSNNNDKKISQLEQSTPLDGSELIPLVQNGVTKKSNVSDIVDLTVNSLVLDASDVGAATQEYVDDKVAGLVDSAPEVLDTLNELASALADDPNFATTVATQVASVQTNLDAEATLRTNADATLQGNIDAEEARALAAEGVLQANIDAEASARASADSTLQANIDAEAVARADADTALQADIDAEEARALTAEGDLETRLDLLESLQNAQIIYVDKSGDDVSGTGGQHKPFATISKALEAITDAAPTKRYVIRVSAGNYTESSNLNIKPNVFIIGDSKESVRISATAVKMDSSFAADSGADNRSGLSNVSVLSACDFDWAEVTSAAGKLYFSEVLFGQAVTLNGHNNAIAQAAFYSCVFFGPFTVSGINIGLHLNNHHWSSITMNQHPNGGMATILHAVGGSCSEGVTLTTTVNDFNRRCSLFAKNFWMRDLTVDGQSSYADLTSSSIPVGGPTVENGGNIIYINQSGEGANQSLSNLTFPTAVNNPIIPANSNATNFGDWGKQWMWSFGYVHASTGSDCYLISYPESYGADSSGKNIVIIADGAGLLPDVDGGNISLSTSSVSGTGLRGEITLNARRVDVNNTKIVNVADGTEATDAVNKGQLDALLDGSENATFTPGNASDWAAPAPTTLKEAIDRIAAALKIQLGNEIP